MLIKKLVKPSIDNSFHFRKDIVPQHHNLWHYHEELELIYISKGSGTFFIGDCIKSFDGGTCVLIGSDVPHYWLFDEPYLTTNNAEIYVIHFREDFAGRDFLNMPELFPLKKLLSDASRGIISNSTPRGLSTLFKNMSLMAGPQRIINLLQMIHIFNEHPDKQELISVHYVSHNQDEDFKRMNTVLAFINENYRNLIELSTLANLAGMTKNSFCRYFKQKTGKTVVEFLTEIRVSHACRLLNNHQVSIKEICFDSGFNNFVSFHKAFKKIVGSTPNIYRRNSFKQKTDQLKSSS